MDVSLANIAANCLVVAPPPVPEPVVAPESIVRAPPT